MRWTVGKLAEISGVSVRTLHHYDEIGLLKPNGRSEAGYRTYTDDDLSRLRQILFYRELEFSLSEIAAILDRGDDRRSHLERQRIALAARIVRLRELQRAIDDEMEAIKMGIELTPEERFEVFGTFKPEKHAGEAEERWGETGAYRESATRAARYAKTDWLKIKGETDVIEQGFAAAFRAGNRADSAEALRLAEAHRLNISTWFYPCDLTMHRNLAEMYIADPRFAAHYDEIEPGLARFVHDAILANAEAA